MMGGDGSVGRMPNEHADLTQELADLIRIKREDAGLTQRKAALLAGRMSESYWRQIESRHPRAVESVTSGKVAIMAYAMDVSPRQLRKIGQDHIANLVQQRREMEEPETGTSSDSESDLERYLMAAPGLSEDSRGVLVSVAMSLLRSQPDAPDSVSA